jgi:hypothetical protein
MVYNTTVANDTAPPAVIPGDNVLSTLQSCNESLLLLQNTSAASAPFGTQFFGSWCVRWLLHVVADAHQPLHAIDVHSAKFPTGDRGG